MKMKSMKEFILEQFLADLENKGYEAVVSEKFNNLGVIYAIDMYPTEDESVDPLLWIGYEIQADEFRIELAKGGEGKPIEFSDSYLKVQSTLNEIMSQIPRL